MDIINDIPHINNDIINSKLPNIQVDKLWCLAIRVEDGININHSIGTSISPWSWIIEYNCLDDHLLFPMTSEITTTSKIDKIQFGSTSKHFFKTSYDDFLTILLEKIHEIKFNIRGVDEKKSLFKSTELDLFLNNTSISTIQSSLNTHNTPKKVIKNNYKNNNPSNFDTKQINMAKIMQEYNMSLIPESDVQVNKNENSINFLTLSNHISSNNASPTEKLKNNKILKMSENFHRGKLQPSDVSMSGSILINNESFVKNR